MANEDKYVNNFTEEVEELAQNDQQFQIAFKSFIALSADLELKDFFILNTSKIKFLSMNVAAIQPENLYWLLHIHFNRYIPKNRRSNPFIGRISKSLNACRCLYFSREHIVGLFNSIFNGNATHRQLLAIWTKLHSFVRNCKTDIAREFVWSDLDQSMFDMNKIINISAGSSTQESSRLTRASTEPQSNKSVHNKPSSSKSTIPCNKKRTVKKEKGVQTTHTFKKFSFTSKTRIDRLKESNRKFKNSLQVAEDKLRFKNVDYEILERECFDLKSKNTNLTSQILKLNAMHESLQSSFKGIKTEYNYVSNELLSLQELKKDLNKIESFSNDPEFCSKVELAKSELKIENFPLVEMRSSRGSINPKINLGITVLRQIGHCSLEKTMPTLVLLGNLLFGQNWDLSNDVAKSRQRSLVPDNVSGVKFILKSPKNKVTKGYIRKFEKEFLEPKSLQSVAEELKNIDTESGESATLMYDHCSINRSKVQTTGVVTTIRDPATGTKTSHYRNLGITNVVRTDTSSTFNSVVSALRNTAVLDSSSTLSSDIHASMRSTLSNVNYTVADGASEMKPVANKIADLKKTLGLETDHLYIHCNAHVCPAFDQAVVIQLSDIAKMLALEDHIVREFNAGFFKKNNAAILTMVRALFLMLGRSTKNQEWSLFRNFHYYLENNLTQVVLGSAEMLKCALF